MSSKTLQPIATATDNSANWVAVAATKAGAVDLPNDDSSTFINIQYSDTGRQSYTLTASRGIPTTASITAVTAFCRIQGLFCDPSQQLRVLSRLTPGGTTSNLTLTLATPSVWTTYSGALPRPTGGSWTPADLNDADLELGVNLASWAKVDSNVAVTTLYLTATFTQAAPTATTDPASSVNVSSAQLNGTLNPGGATAQYPVSYFFQWGTTAAYGNVTSTVAGNTGSASTAVSANLSGLSANTTYHFRLVATNTDNTVTGIDRTFSTGASDTALMVF